MKVNELLKSLGRSKETAIYQLIPKLEQISHDKFQVVDTWIKLDSYSNFISTGDYAILWKDEKDLKSLTGLLEELKKLKTEKK